MLEGSCDAMENTQAGAGSWQYLWPHGGPMLEQSIPEGLYAIKKTRGKDSRWRSLLRTAAHVKDPY